MSRQHYCWCAGLVALLVRCGGAAESLGILNATTCAGVTADGASDVTLALQRCISQAYEAQLALFLPPGRYLVSDTLWANQSNYGSSLPVNLRPARWRTNVLLGAPSPRRPTIVLAPRSGGFGDASAPKNVLKVHNTGRCATRSILLARAWLMRAMVAGRTTT